MILKNFLIKIKVGIKKPTIGVGGICKMASIEKKSIFKYYTTEVNNYQRNIKRLEKIKSKLNRDDFIFLKKILHPLNDFLIEKEVLEDEMKFLQWVLKYYPLTSEQRKKFTEKRKNIRRELNSLGRLLKILKQKWG
jgi:hypothetical protein